ncbi:MAG: hypothetical protein KC584_05910, partial [Nitrospira sp.]|nr:hypothetical protein [Nitrospira sp.]
LKCFKVETEGFTYNSLNYLQGVLPFYLKCFKVETEGFTYNSLNDLQGVLHPRPQKEGRIIEGSFCI